MSKLITSTLINAIDWFKDAPLSINEETGNSWKQGAFADLKNILARDYSKAIPDIVKKGIDFENTVYSIVEKLKGTNIDINKLPCSKNFKDVLIYTSRGEFQKKSKSYICVDNIEYCLYGKIDITFSSRLADLKYTEKPLNKISENKYLNTFQHKIYCYNEQIRDFDYVVCSCNKETGIIEGVAFFSYTATSFEKLEEELRNKIREVVNFLKLDEELWDLYNNKFCIYG